MEKKDIIVIGASAGGLEVLKRLFSDLNPQINAAIFVVWHMAPNVHGILPRLLSKHTSIPMNHAEDGESIAMNRVYIATPDRHLLIEDGIVRVSKGPKENRFRPAIDPLFRSAAYAYGTRVIGVVLSGSLSDGTAGLWTIKHFGGTAVVQDPKDSEYPSMPESAMRQVQVDFRVPVSDMPKLLSQLTNETVGTKSVQDDELEKTRNEVRVAMMGEENGEKVKDLGTLTPYTCPECHGVLSEIREGDLIRFRCHTGHAFSVETLLSDLSDTIERSIWNAIRGMEESSFLLKEIGDRLAATNQPKLSGSYFKKARAIEARSKYLRQALLKNERLTKDTIEKEHTDRKDEAEQGIRNKT